MIAPSMVDAALERIEEDEDGSSASALADLLDYYGEWEWTDGAEHCPSDRLAVVESSGAWWCVYRGVEPDRAWRFSSRHEAEAKLDELQSESES